MWPSTFFRQNSYTAFTVEKVAPKFALLQQLKKLPRVNNRQGDQIGRIFAEWAIVYLVPRQLVKRPLVKRLLVKRLLVKKRKTTFGKKTFGKKPFRKNTFW
jgi:hypothetical protein